MELKHFREQVEKYLKTLNRGLGRYAFRQEDQEPALFGSIDAAMIRVIMGEDLCKTVDPAERQEWADCINSFQNEDGSYSGGLSHIYHTNGNAVGALSVLRMKHRYSTKGLYKPFETAETLRTWLHTEIDWKENQWRDSQKFRGGPHMFYFTSWAANDWKEALFEWLDRNLDPATGRWTKSAPAKNLRTHIGGGSHIWPIYEHTGHPFPYPEKIIDSILELAHRNGSFGKIGSFIHADALHGLKVMCAQNSDYRTQEIADLLVLHREWLESRISSFLFSKPDIHSILAVCDEIGVLNQLGAVEDEMEWTDHFSGRIFYNSKAVMPA
jgi:hypothetical protein